MKITTTIAAVLITLLSYSQEGITLNVTQDVKLATVGDDNGNNAITPDISIGLEMQGNQSDYGYMIVRPEFEYADLSGGLYKRYSANVGYSFNQWVENLTLTASIGYGFIDHNGARSSFGNNLQVSYDITDSLSLMLDLETTERKDLAEYQSEVLGTAFRVSGKFGIKFRIFNKQ